MAIADNFDHKPDAGFVRSYDARAARRQLQVSVGLVLIVAMATLALGLLLHKEKPASSAQLPPIKWSTSYVAESLLDNRN